MYISQVEIRLINIDQANEFYKKFPDAIVKTSKKKVI